MPSILNRILSLVRHRQLEAELDEEIDFHRARQQETLQQAGLSTEEASLAARRTLGNVTLAREDARRMLDRSVG